MSKQTKEPQQNSVAAAEQTLKQLEQKARDLVTRGAELDEQRRAAAFGAHAERDPEARKALDKVNAESATHASELRSVDDAIAQAKSQDAATRADREAAKRLRETFKQFVALAVSLDEALGTVVETSAAMSAVVNEIHALGHGAPTGQQWLSYGERALHTAMMQTPWSRSVQHLAPRERRIFADLARDWQAGAERAIAQRLNEQPKESADAA